MVAVTTMDSVERVVVLECTGVTKVLSELWHAMYVRCECLLCLKFEHFVMYSLL